MASRASRRHEANGLRVTVAALGAAVAVIFCGTTMLVPLMVAIPTSVSESVR